MLHIVEGQPTVQYYRKFTILFLVKKATILHFVRIALRLEHLKIRLSGAIVQRTLLIRCMLSS